jgi:3-oxoadipate enol-lactonase
MRLHYELAGPAEAPLLVLASSLGTSVELWAANLPLLSGSLRVLRYDQRGHGASEVTPGPYSVEELAGDLLGLVDHVGVETFSLCGLSLGGAPAMWLAAHAPERIDRLVLACTSARFGEPQQWLDRAAVVRQDGLEPIADSVVGRWFTPAFAAVDPETVGHFRALLLSTPPEGYAGCCEALAGWDFRDGLAGIRVPTLVIGAAEDRSAPLADAELLAREIPGAALAVLPNAAHLANVQQPAAFAELVREHVAQVEVV